MDDWHTRQREHERRRRREERIESAILIGWVAFVITALILSAIGG